MPSWRLKIRWICGRFNSDHGLKQFGFNNVIWYSITMNNTDILIKEHNNRARISIAMLDIGRFRHDFLQQCIRYLQDKNLDIIFLPDTSGILTPNQVFDKIDRLSSGNTRIAIHCHNDMGMATANGIMGILAGGRVLEASALGIGERNGITDLYTAGKTLKELGFKIRLNTDDIETFRVYYHYVDNIVRDQTGIRLFTPCTPGLGNAISTHVAGTHADGDFGRSRDEAFCINVLCGNTLVKKILDLHGIGCPGEKISELVSAIKDQSSRLNRSLAPEDIKTLILSFPD